MKQEYNGRSAMRLIITAIKGASLQYMRRSLTAMRGRWDGQGCKWRTPTSGSTLLLPLHHPHCWLPLPRVGRAAQQECSAGVWEERMREQQLHVSRRNHLCNCHAHHWKFGCKGRVLIHLLSQLNPSRNCSPPFTRCPLARSLTTPPPSTGPT
jgi:hypothetical protein